MALVGWSCLSTRVSEAERRSVLFARDPSIQREIATRIEPVDEIFVWRSRMMMSQNQHQIWEFF